ncbi:MAG: c-type cytochrome [Thermoanaerobaculia bacterium]
MISDTPTLPPTIRPGLRTAATIFALLLLAAPSAGQIPDEFNNLEVLPADISKAELVSTMRHISLSLDLRCHHCHAGEPQTSFDTYDFASDQKPLKETARVMMRMVDEINGKLLAPLGKDAADRIVVRCATCHHSQRRPQTLAEVLRETLDGEGTEAAIARYRELRERYYGGNTYHFGEWQLLFFSETLAEAELPEAEHAFLRLNRELHPDFWWTSLYFGEYYRRHGDKEQAIAEYRKVIEMEPARAPRIQPIIDELSAEGAPAGPPP